MKLGVALARHTRQLEGEAISHLFQRLSILLVQGNAALVINCILGQLHSSIGCGEKCQNCFNLLTCYGILLYNLMPIFQNIFHNS